VIALGFVSLLTDASSEMIYPLLPAFLTSLGAGGTVLGLIEGIAEATASFVKLLSGIWADRLPRKKPLVVAGYGLASLVRPLVALATSPWHVLAIRFTDRVGKGLRGSPRDALMAQVTPLERRGLAFGFHRAMDHTGALIGPLIAFVMMSGFDLDYRTIFALSLVPGLATLAVVSLGVREPAASPIPLYRSDDRPDPLNRLPRAFRNYLAVLAVFSLGNSSDAFLLLKATEAGVSAEQVPLLWAWIHVIKALLSTHLGGLSDHLGRKPTIVAGWVTYAVCYLGFAAASQAWQIWVLFTAYGAFFAATEGAERALVADLAPPESRGRAFGAFHFLLGVTVLPASLGFGWLWDTVGAQFAFGVGAILAGLASVGLILLVRTTR
jgi:MFS family permease